jgi:hypothetical protein
MIEFWRDWLNPVISNQWVVFSIGGGLGLLLLYFLFRSGLYIRRYGFRNWLRATFQIDSESWRLIGILLFVAIAAALMYLRAAG